MGCTSQVGWTLAEVVKALEKPQYHWNSVVVKFLITRSDLDVHFLHDVDVQKCGAVVESPEFHDVLCRNRQHHADALDSASLCRREQTCCRKRRRAVNPTPAQRLVS